MLKIQGETGVVRDPSNQAILTTDMPSLAAYRKKKSQQHRIENAVTEIDDIKSQLIEIKTLVHQILEKS